MEENNEDVAESIFSEMDEEKQVNREQKIVEKKPLTEMSRKELRKKWSENTGTKCELSTQINELLLQRKALTKENVQIRKLLEGGEKSE